MANFRTILGWIPKTEAYEAKQDALRQEYAELLSFSKSEELSEFLELERQVLSPEFARRKKEIVAQRYADTSEYRKEKEYYALKKSRDIRHYYATKDSIALKDFLEFENSFDVKHFHTLEKFTSSEEFSHMRKSLGRKFKSAPEYEKLVEFRALKRSKRFRDYFAFKNSKDYINFTLLIGSERISGYEQLEQFLQTPEFLKVKEYMLLPGRKKLELSDEHKMELKYKGIKKSEKFQWYFKVKDSARFNEVKKWVLTFSDEFDKSALDAKKWITRHYWGEAMLKDNYVNDGEKQFYPGVGNIEVSGGILKINTLFEKVTGKVWNPALGFFTREFDVTSGIINSGNSFRQQYGLFEAKVRFNRNYPVHHGIWMVSELMLPHIDLARAGKRISVGTYWSNPNAKGGVDKRSASLGRGHYGFDYFIFSLEWTREKLTWKINGVPLLSATEGIPHVPMYININSSLYREADNTLLPATMEVDWVRCYQKA
jgi:hypothetical protein